MKINFTPLTRKLFALILGKKNYKEVSSKNWILCPGESYATQPAIYLEEDLNKITSVGPATSLAREYQRIQGGIREHKATTAYLLEDVEIINGYVYKGPMKYTVILMKETHINFTPTTNHNQAVLACTYNGHRYFGHWMSDDLSLKIAAKELGEPIEVKHIPYSHEPGYLKLFQINCQTVDYVKCNELIIIDDVGQNKYKKQRYQYLRKQLSNSKSPSSQKSVMLLRGLSGAKRLLINELEIAEFLKAQGFKIIDPLQMTPQEIVNSSLGAKVVISVEGSQLAHGLYSIAEDGVVLALQPPDRFNNVYKDRLDCIGVKYGFLVGEKVEDGFTISLDSLARMLEKSDILPN